MSFSPPHVCEVNGSCVMCGSAPPLSKPDLPFNRPLLERVAHQDHSIHPVLSMQSGEMHSQMQLELTTIFTIDFSANNTVILCIQYGMYTVLLYKMIYKSVYIVYTYVCFFKTFYNIYISAREIKIDGLAPSK